MHSAFSCLSQDAPVQGQDSKTANIEFVLLVIETFGEASVESCTEAVIPIFVLLEYRERTHLRVPTRRHRAGRSASNTESIFEDENAPTHIMLSQCPRFSVYMTAEFVQKAKAASWHDANICQYLPS